MIPPFIPVVLLLSAAPSSFQSAYTLEERHLPFKCILNWSGKWFRWVPFQRFVSARTWDWTDLTDFSGTLTWSSWKSHLFGSQLCCVVCYSVSSAVKVLNSVAVRFTIVATFMLLGQLLRPGIPLEKRSLYQTRLNLAKWKDTTEINITCCFGVSRGKHDCACKYVDAADLQWTCISRKLLLRFRPTKQLLVQTGAPMVQKGKESFRGKGCF